MIFNLGLSRLQLVKAYQIATEDLDFSQSQLQYWFGHRQSYGFLKFEEVKEIPAPKYEFGRLTLTQKQRNKIWSDLPSEIRDQVVPEAKTHWGPYHSVKGNYLLKHEYDNIWTILMPKDNLSELADRITLKETSQEFAVSEVLVQSHQRSLLVSLEEI